MQARPSYASVWQQVETYELFTDVRNLFVPLGSGGAGGSAASAASASGGGGAAGGSGGSIGGSGGSDLSPLVIQTGQLVAGEQHTLRYATAGRGVVESLPFGSGGIQSGLYEGNRDNDHAEAQVVAWAKTKILALKALGLAGAIDITVITGVAPCDGVKYPGFNCQLNFQTQWAPQLRGVAATAGLTLVSVRDLWWPWSYRDSQTPKERWDY